MHVRTESAPEAHRVFRIGTDCAKGSMLEPRLCRGDILGPAIERGLQARGYASTRDPGDAAIDGVLVYRLVPCWLTVDSVDATTGWKNAGALGSLVNPVGPHLLQQQLEILDWRVGEASDGVLASLQPVWAGSLAGEDLDLDRAEASELAMNLLEEFPAPAQTGRFARPIVPVRERHGLRARVEPASGQATPEG